MSPSKFYEDESLNPVDKEIGRLIRKAREHLNLSVESIAEELGISPDKLLRYELGESRPTPHQLLTLCAVLRVQPGWFFPEVWSSEDTSPETPFRKDDPILSTPTDVSAQASSLSPEARIEVSFPGQISISVGRNFDEVTFRRVVEVLRMS